MPIFIAMPRMSDTMEEGTLNKWHVKVGDEVKSGSVLADVETDKATMELQTWEDGTVARLAIKEGEVAPVGKLILVLAAKGESVEDAAKAEFTGGGAPAAGKPAPSGGGAAATDAPAAPAAATDDAGEESQTTATGARVRISPLARKIAEEMKVDVARIKGTGPDGRIIKRDILAAAAEPAPAGKPAPSGGGAAPASGGGGAKPQAAPTPVSQNLASKTVTLSGMRKTIARRLVESKTTIPHFTVTVAIDMDAVLALRVTLNEQLASQNVKLSVNDFVVKACAAALTVHPLVNASWAGDTIQQHGQINVGVAVALPQDKGGGLVVPVIRDANVKGLRTVSVETKQLADKARGAGLSAQEMSDGTFTISNLGMFGVEHFEAIINPPQAAILAVGAAIKKPVVKNDQIVVGHEMAATLSADHRVIDGAMAAEFLVTLKKLLENPAMLLV